MRSAPTCRISRSSSAVRLTVDAEPSFATSAVKPVPLTATSPSYGLKARRAGRPVRGVKASRRRSRPRWWAAFRWRRLGQQPAEPDQRQRRPAATARGARPVAARAAGAGAAAVAGNFAAAHRVAGYGLPRTSCKTSRSTCFGRPGGLLFQAQGRMAGRDPRAARGLLAKPVCTGARKQKDWPIAYCCV